MATRDKQQQFTEIALKAKEQLVTDLTDVAWVALDKAGLKMQHGEKEYETLHSAITDIVG